MTSLEVRNRLVEALRLEALGPSAEDEELEDRPSSHYLCGILWPQGTEIEPDQNEEQPPGDDEEGSAGFEPTIPLVQTLNPSSIGLSLILEPAVQTIEVSATWGEYRREPVEENAKNGTTAQGRRVWRRVPNEPPAVTIDFAQRPNGEDPVSADGLVHIEWLARPMSGATAISVFLVNRRPTSDDPTQREERCVFQPKLRVTSPDDSAFILGRPPEALDSATTEELANRLLYREELQFAVGHGCATDWESDRGSSLARKAWTEVLPAHQLRPIAPRGSIPGLELDMVKLGEASTPDELVGMLEALPTEYETWISDLESEVGGLGLEERLRSQGADHLASCREAAHRIRSGIQLLQRDRNAFRAFCLMNSAMALQRSRTDLVRRVQEGAAESHSTVCSEGAWRPFQIAFILQALEGCFDPTHGDRRLVDLLWFPTGGGKTEAYLGLTAFVALHRRLAFGSGSHGGAGVTVLMRYTLRLLTVQQFQRATTLMCALEYLRDSERELGDIPFRVGIWVGAQTTPNTFEESERILSELIRGQQTEGASPRQLVVCPWCGESLRVRDYRAFRVLARTLVGCPRRECPFSFDNRREGIPVITVDEEIYRTVPTLLIGTVDKFARLPWKGEAQTIFGRVDRLCPRHGFLSPADDHPEAAHNARGDHTAVSVASSGPLPPPELIIQDELHLISGPLGSMVGLYEAGIDWLCTTTSNGTRRGPKIVASTATIRRASEQVWALFGRDVRVFPPPALSYDDSYFAIPDDHKPGRLYLGVFAPGKSVKTAQVRVMALLLAAGLLEHDHDPLTADPYMTLVGYYNSLRELGGASTLVRDDVGARLNVLSGRGYPQRHVNEVRELTSREASSRIPVTLDQLAIPYKDRGNGKYPIDVLLATSLISVGVDILRLGLMLVIGQPKATAEYIQSTSRVGRQDPGLITTIYNWTRPRDLSHYERFRSYHATLYRHVEATSVTPFSARAIDRGLHGIFVGMCRMANLMLTPESAARSFVRTDDVVIAAREALIERARAIGGAPAEQDVRQELEARQDVWQRLTVGGPLRYSWESPHRLPPPGVAILLRWAGRQLNGVWPTPASLREVEPHAGFFLVDEP